MWDEFPKIYDGTAAGAKSDEQPAAVRARAETDYKAALARGDELIRQEKFPEAVGVVDRFLYDVDLDEYRSRAQKDKARIRAKVDRAKGALAKQERAEQRGFAKALTREAEALRRAYDFSGARGLLRRAEGIYTDIGS